MKKQIILTLAATALGLAATASAYAQFGGLKNEIKKQKKKAKKKIKTTTTSSTSSPLGTPSANLTSLTNCAGFSFSNVTIGRLGKYTFQQGFSKEDRTGFIERKPGTSEGCVITSGLQKDQVLYFEVDAKTYKKTKSGNDWTLQCVESDNPGGGTVSLEETNGTSDNYLSDSHMKLHCGNSEGLSDCASGTNSKRAQAYSSDLAKRGKYGVSFLARANKASKRGESKKLYCQYYNKPTGKSLVAFEMISKSPHN